MAPMAAAVTDAHEHQLVLRLRLGKGLIAPGVPVHRVVGVLQEIDRAFAREVVGRLTIEVAFAVSAAADGQGEEEGDASDLDVWMPHAVVKLPAPIRREHKGI